MNRQEFAKGIKILEITYNQTFDEEKRDFWYRQLQDLDTEIYFNNIKEQIRINVFMPNIAQIRGENGKKYINYKQRDYSSLNFNRFYANQCN